MTERKDSYLCSSLLFQLSQVKNFAFAFISEEKLFSKISVTVAQNKDDICKFKKMKSVFNY